jgi:hypothetical protein
MKTNTNRSLIHWAVRFTFAALTLQPLTAAPLGTAFTYQGRLIEGTNAYTGNAEFQATLWDVASGGTALATNASGSVIVGVTNGLFVLPLDFGTNFPGTVRWLQLEVRTTIGAFTTLSPRQALTPAPYALYASSADTAATASSVPAANITGTLSDTSLSGNVALLNGNQSFSGANTFGNAGNSYSGNGFGLTSLNANNLASGTMPDGRLSANIPRLNNNQTFTGNNIFSGNNSFTGDGSGLTSLNANNLNVATAVPGTCLSGLYSGLVNFNNAGNSFVGSFSGSGAGLTSLNANNLASGTVPDGRLSVNVDLLNGNQAFTGVKTFNTAPVFPVAPSFSSGGTPFTVSSSTLVNNLNADLLDGQQGSFYQNAGNLTAGTLTDARLSANVALLAGSQAFTGTKTFTVAPSFPTAPTFSAVPPFVVNSATLVANLNADLLDGSQAGNATNNIPLSNGTVNSGLNADMVDGIHGAGLMQLRASGLISGGNALTITIPHYTIFTLELASGQADWGGMAFVEGFENDQYATLFYMKFNADGTSAVSGGSGNCQSTNLLLQFGNSTYGTNTVRCAADAGGVYPCHLNLRAGTYELLYRLIY